MTKLELLASSATDDVGFSKTQAEIIEALRSENIELLERHRLEIRRLEIASYQAELRLAAHLRHASQQLNEATARLSILIAAEEARAMIPQVMTYGERGAIGKLLFRRNGKPHKPLRVLLFSRSGRPRKFSRFLVINKNGMPRRRFRQWMLSPGYQRLPGAVQF
jgi:hypothetical protein